MIDIASHLAQAIRETELIQRVLADGTPCGLALCTDGTVGTLYVAMYDSRWLRENEEKEFWPPDWPYEDGGDASLDGPAEQIEQLYRAASDRAANGDSKAMREHINFGFGVLVESLAVLRAKGLFGDQVVLLVMATDPNPTMLRLADEAVSRLNSSEVLTRYRAQWPVSRWRTDDLRRRGED